MLIPPDYYPKKAPKPGDSGYEKLKRSIVEFGLVDPVIWNERTGNLVSGRRRLVVMRSLGYTEADASVVDLPLEREKVLCLAIQKIPESNEWDLPLLKDLLHNLETLPVDLSLTAFDEAEIEKLLGRKIIEDGFDFDAAVENIETPFTQLGDIYQLGKHRLMCGDSTSSADFALLMDGQVGAMAFTDPPYNVNYGASLRDKAGEAKGLKSAGRKILNDHFASNEGFYQFLRAAIAAMRPYISGDIYICMSSSELHTLQRAFLDCGGHFSTFIIWVKNHFTIGRANYQRQYEPILYGWFEGTSHYWSGIRTLADVYGPSDVLRDVDGTPMVRVEACAIESDIWECPRPIKSPEHPTMKPIALCARGIMNSSLPGALVVEGFGGSGSTMMACEQTGRACNSMELSPVFCDVIVQRWETFTGSKADLIRRI